MLLGVLNALEFLVTEDFFCQQGKAHLTQGLLALLDSVSPAVQRRHRFLLDFFLQTGDFRRPDIRGIGDQHINFLRHKAQSL